ncbi:MAG TPA: FkbM family methyltransferase [Clostridia bacterium]|nr:FkbM family methyltransferase [Clostridia bacterium]
MPFVKFDDTSWRSASFRAVLWLSKHLPRGMGPLLKMARSVVGERYIKIRRQSASPIWLCPNHSIDYEALFGPGYEPSTAVLIRRYVAAGFHYIDVGANIGLHLVEACHAAKSSSSMCFGFEPEPKAFQVLQRNCESSGYKGAIRLQNKAVGAKIGDAQLFVSTTWNQGNHSLCPRPGNHASTSCAVTTLDHELLSKKDQLASIFLKIDVEGWEVDVLRGARNLLCAANNVAILCEASEPNLRRAGKSLKQLADMVEELGFSYYYEVVDGQKGLAQYPIARAFRMPIGNIFLVRGPDASRLLPPAVSTTGTLPLQSKS